MPSVSLYDISNRPEGGYPPRERRLGYRVNVVDEYWWQLDVDIPVEFRFAYEHLPGRWDRTQKETFKAAFRANAAHAWSRRHLLHNESRSINTEVRITVSEHRGAHNSTSWIVCVYPLTSDLRESTRCDYTFGGWLVGNGPRSESGAIIPESGPELRSVAVCYVGAEDVGCTPTAGTQYIQRGTDHEVGHMLGMQHPACNDSRNRICYGRTDAERSRIMGSGHRVTRADYVWAQKLMGIYREGWQWEIVRDARTSSIATCGPPVD